MTLLPDMLRTDGIPWGMTVLNRRLSLPITGYMRNIYDLAHVNGDIYDVEADCYERDGEDWVFFDGEGKEIHRVCWLDILSVSKSTLRPAPPQAEPERIWI